MLSCGASARDVDPFGPCIYTVSLSRSNFRLPSTCGCEKIAECVSLRADNMCALQSGQ